MIRNRFLEQLTTCHIFETMLAELLVQKKHTATIFSATMVSRYFENNGFNLRAFGGKYTIHEV